VGYFKALLLCWRKPWERLLELSLAMPTAAHAPSQSITNFCAALSSCFSQYRPLNRCWYYVCDSTRQKAGASTACAIVQDSKQALIMSVIIQGIRPVLIRTTYLKTAACCDLYYVTHNYITAELTIPFLHSAKNRTVMWQTSLRSSDFRTCVGHFWSRNYLTVRRK